MPKAFIFSHYFHPDDMVSAVHLSDLAEGLIARGWEVTAMPCNRGRHDESRAYLRVEEWKGVRIRRIWRPNLRQNSSSGRILNGAWMIFRWSLAALYGSSPDVVIISTDPPLSLLVARFWKLARRKTRIVHWCFDLYPEAAIAAGVLKEQGLANRLIQWFLPAAYRCCDLIADIGSCMRKRLASYRTNAKSVTLTPWALAEPEAPLPIDREEREHLFADATLGLMYSGNFGRAHSYEEILELARRLRGRNIRLVFSIRGNREHAVREAVCKNHDVNVSFCGFAAPDGIRERLSAADIHVVSLRTDWTGLVVPSKFFGALAVGRPVLFAGSPESAVAIWIESYRLGWVLTPGNIDQVADQIAAYMTIPEECSRMRQHCHEIYHRHFSKDKILDAFDQELRELLAAPAHSGKSALAGCKLL